jgi:hypothetical protein
MILSGGRRRGSLEMCRRIVVKGGRKVLIRFEGEDGKGGCHGDSIPP